MKNIPEGKLLAVDTETTGLDPWHGDCPFAVAFCNEEGETVCYEWPVDPKTRKVTPVAEELRAVKRVMEDPSIEKLLHNAKFDLHMLEENFGIVTRGLVHDTMFLAHICDSMEPTYALKPLCRKYLGIGDDDQQDLKKAVIRLRRHAAKLGWKIAYEESVDAMGNEKKKAQVEADYWLVRAMQKFNPAYMEKAGIDPELCATYNKMDVERTMMLYHMYRQAMVTIQQTHEQRELEREQGAGPAKPRVKISTQKAVADLKQLPLRMEATYDRELRMFPVVYNAEAWGIRTFPEVTQAEIKRVQKEAHEWWDKLQDIARKAGMKGVDPSKDAQLIELLFTRLKLPVKMRTEKTKQPAVNQEALEAYHDSPAVVALLQFRSAMKAYGTYNKYIHFSAPDREDLTIRSLRTDYQQLGPATSRMSSRRPNLMQVANPATTRGLAPQQERNGFGPREGKVWLCVDYGGQEMRIFADVSGEPTMTQAYLRNEDVHGICCNMVWGGKDNPEAIRALTRVLISSTQEAHPPEELQAFWKKAGVRDPSRLKEADLARIAVPLLDEHKWDINKSEAAIGKKVTRQRIKQINFIKIFGGGPAALGGIMRVPLAEAERVMSLYDRKFPRVEGYSKELMAAAKRDGYIVNKFGRKLTIDSDYLYRCVNYMVQGTAADQTKEGAIGAYDMFRKEGIDGRVLMFIHDELVFELGYPDFTKNTVRKICRVMERDYGVLKIPAVAEPSVVWKSWDKKEKVLL